LTDDPGQKAVGEIAPVVMEIFDAITKYPRVDPVLSEFIIDVSKTVPFNEEYEPLSVVLLPMDCNSLRDV
jgi:hypothetical protein